MTQCFILSILTQLPGNIGCVFFLIFLVVRLPVNEQELNVLHAACLSERASVKSLTIAKKLIFLVFVALTSLVLFGGVAIYEMRSAQQRFDTVQHTVIPSIVLLSETNAHSAAIRSAVRDYIIGGFLDDKELQKTQLKNLDDLKKKINDNLDRYQKDYQTSDQDKTLLENDRKALATYLAEVSDVFSKVERQDVPGLSQQFSATGKFRVTAGELIGSFSEHAVHNQKYADSLQKMGDEAFRNGMMLLAVVGTLAFLLLGGLGFILVRGIVRSLDSMQTAISRIEGDLDFTARAEVIGSDEIARVATSLNRLIEKLRTSLQAITDSTTKVSEAAEQLAQASSQVAATSSNQSDSASSMAASVEQMTVSISHISDRSSDAHALSNESGQYAVEGETVISQTVSDINQIAESVGQASQRIQELDASSQQISTIVSVIKEVAEQTNLLALNAAIEAARAGEQGRGFAVVADEVRKLAERTSTSTQEISTRIEAIRSVSKGAVESMANAVSLVETGVGRASNASGAIQRISHASQQAVTMVEEITAAIREQSQTSTMIASSVEGIAQMAEESSAAAKNSAESAHDLDEIAKQMRNVVAAYRL